MSKVLTRDEQSPIATDWRETRLGDAAKVQTGGTPRVSNKAFWDGDIPFYSSGELNSLYTGEAERTVTSQGLASSNAKIFPKGSLVIGMYDTAALKTSILDRDAAFNQAIAGVEPNENIDLIFVLHQIGWKKVELLAQRRGVRQKNLNLGKIRDIRLSLPPLSEQKRIVAILHEAFADIAKAKASMEKNLENARELFESALRSSLTRCSEMYPEHSLLALCSSFFDSAHRTPKYQEDGLPAVGPRDVVNGKLNLEKARRVSLEEYQIQTKRYAPKPGDIIYSRELSYGWAAAIPTGTTLCLSQGMCVFTLKPGVDPAYLLLALNGSYGREQAQAIAVGASHPHLNLGPIKAMQFPVPPLEAQTEIRQHLKSLYRLVEHLHTIYQQKLAALEELRQSLLHQAFTGQL